MEREERIELTRDEALTILKHLSILEGYLMSVPNSSHVIDIVDFSVNLLTSRING